MIKFCLVYIEIPVTRLMALREEFQARFLCEQVLPLLIHGDATHLGLDRTQDDLTGQFLDFVPQDVQVQHALGQDVDLDWRRERPA